VVLGLSKLYVNIKFFFILFIPCNEYSCGNLYDITDITCLYFLVMVGDRNNM